MSLLHVVLGLGAALLLWFLIEKSRRRAHPVTGGLQSSITLPHAQEFELYANAFSHCSRKVRLAMAEAGIDYAYHQIDLIETGKYETISAAYLKVNPSGLMPTLVHNGHPIYESDDIMAYVSGHAARETASLVPSEPGAKSQMDAWVDMGVISSDDPMSEMKERAGSCIPGLTLPIFVTAIRYIPLHRILVGFLFHPDKKRPAFFAAAKLFGLERMMKVPPVAAMMRAGRTHMLTHLEALADQLRASGGPWILGDQYTLADITWSCILLRLDETGWMREFLKDVNLAPIATYYEALKQRPSWHKAIASKAHPIVDKAALDLAEAQANSAIVQATYAGDGA